MDSIIIMSGGSGERLWPVSRQNYPKQYAQLLNKPLLESSIERFKNKNIFLLTTKEQQYLLKNTDYCDGTHFLFEPEAKNTAPALAFMCKKFLLENKQDEIVGVFSSDHLIQKEDVFKEALSVASTEARNNKIVTLGIKPNHPATGYGYIQVSSDKNMQPHDVIAFKEKPDLSKAQEYIKDGNYFWNAGIFIFKISTMIQAFKDLEPKLWSSIDTLKPDFSNLDEVYSQLDKISIDYAIMEKANNISCIPCDIGWTDLGSWDSMAEVSNQENNLQKNTDLIESYGESKNNYVFNQKETLTAFIDVKDLIVVNTPDALLISKKGSSQKIKPLLANFKEKQIKEATEHMGECRPWGKFEVLSHEEKFKFKKITVLPDQRLSYQSHRNKNELWLIIEGQANITLNNQSREALEGDHFYIPKGTKHRIENVGETNLIFLEIQTGSYLGEDDIIRYEDDYNRV